MNFKIVYLRILRKLLCIAYSYMLPAQQLTKACTVGRSILREGEIFGVRPDLPRGSPRLLSCNGNKLKQSRYEVKICIYRCTCEIKCRIAMAKAAFHKKRALLTSTLDLELRKKLMKCYIWSIALYCAETWTLRQQIGNTWKVLKCGAGEEWKRSVGLIM